MTLFLGNKSTWGELPIFHWIMICKSPINTWIGKSIPGLMVNGESEKVCEKTSQILQKPSKYQVFLGRFCGSNHLQRRCDRMFREGSPNCFRLIPPFGAFRYGARRSIRSFAQGFHQLGHALLHGRCTRRRRGQDRGPWLWLTCLGNNLETPKGC